MALLELPLFLMPTFIPTLYCPVDGNGRAFVLLIPMEHIYNMGEETCATWGV